MSSRLDGGDDRRGCWPSGKETPGAPPETRGQGPPRDWVGPRLTDKGRPSVEAPSQGSPRNVRRPSPHQCRLGKATCCPAGTSERTLGGRRTISVVAWFSSGRYSSLLTIRDQWIVAASHALTSQRFCHGIRSTGSGWGLDSLALWETATRSACRLLVPGWRRSSADRDSRQSLKLRMAADAGTREG